jgi:hypothetical protein
VYTLIRRGYDYVRRYLKAVKALHLGGLDLGGEVSSEVLAGRFLLTMSSKVA